MNLFWFVRLWSRKECVFLFLLTILDVRERDPTMLVRSQVFSKDPRSRFIMTEHFIACHHANLSLRLGVEWIERMDGEGEDSLVAKQGRVHSGLGHHHILRLRHRQAASARHGKPLLQNIAKPHVKAGSIIGGIFLQEFVGDTKWAHLDIAGTGWNTKAVGYPNSGASAFGVRVMSEFCLRQD